VGHSQEMSEGVQTTRGSWWRTSLLDRVAELRQHEDQVILVLALVIGALTGLAVVAFILLTERMGMRLYPVGGAPWRRLLFPVVGSLGIGYLLYRYFPNARGSGVPQTKAALYAREGRIRCAPYWASFSARRQRLPAESRWGAKGLRFKLVRALLRCLGASSDCAPSK
jgi:chloride channel protein, CIC family